MRRSLIVNRFRCHSTVNFLLDIAPRQGNFRAMADRTVQLVLHYDGARFLGWQRQPTGRTVQGELERVFERLFGVPTPITGAGRTDAGVHARGQAAHVQVSERWTTTDVQRAANALLPDDVWVAEVHEMQPGFHARYSAVSRRYRYYVGTDAGTFSPFRRRYEWPLGRPLDGDALRAGAAAVLGEHVFRGFAVRGTAPEHDHHRCDVTTAAWEEREGGYVFVIEANRFLHHMVRFLVATMVDVARGRRTLASLIELLSADDNHAVSAPAPPHGLFLDRVTYPRELYRESSRDLSFAGA
jgi:tRNA pseudouridine38-40 synthase